MSIRDIDTIIAVMAGKTVRFDAASDGILVLARKDRAGIADAVSTSLKAKPVRRGSRVFVLAADFFTQAVRLPAPQTNGLSKADLLSTLIFEVEPFSNIARDQGQAAYTAGEESAGNCTWHVLQISNSDMTAITAAVRASNAKTVGLAQADGIFLSAPEQDLPGLFKGVATDAVTSAPSFPIIVPAPARLGANQIALCSGLGFAAVFIACLTHFVLASARLSTLKESVQKREALESANAQIASSTQAVETKMAALEKKRADRAAAEREIDRYRTAWAVLVRSIPETCGRDVVIQRIEGGSFFDAEIAGLSAVEKGPGDCMAKLAQRIGATGWRIHSERMQTVASMGGNGSLRFSFHVSLKNEIKP